MALARGSAGPGSTAPHGHPERGTHGGFGARAPTISWEPGLGLAFLGREPEQVQVSLACPGPEESLLWV